MTYLVFIDVYIKRKNDFQPKKQVGDRRLKVGSPLNLPSKHLPLNKIFCSKRNFSKLSTDEKFISRETDLHFKIALGRCADRREN